MLKRTAAWDRVCVTSFSGARLLAAQRSLDRPVCLAVTPAAIVAVRYLGFCGKGMARGLARYGALCAQVPRKIATRGFIRRSHALGLDGARMDTEHAEPRSSGPSTSGRTA